MRTRASAPCFGDVNGIVFDDQHDCRVRIGEPVDLLEQAAVLDRRRKIGAGLSFHGDGIENDVVADRQLRCLNFDAGRFTKALRGGRKALYGRVSRARIQVRESSGRKRMKGVRRLVRARGLGSPYDGFSSAARSGELLRSDRDGAIRVARGV